MPIKFKDVAGLTATEHNFHKGYFWIFKGEMRVGSYSTKRGIADVHIVKSWNELKCNNLHQAMRWVFLKTQKPRK